jgi:AmiR/NasT family two-component response regulator
VTVPGEELARGEMQQRIDALEAQHDTDQKIIRQLVDEGLIDRERIANLETALITARKIGCAIGILMCKRQLTDGQALDLLRSTSLVQQRKVRDLAEDVILTGTLE